MRQALREEFPALVSLALPLVVGELGWMAMSVVDTAMLGRTAEPSLSLAASALAQVLFNTLAFGTGGILLALDALIAQAFGEGKRDEANHWFHHGLALAGLLVMALTTLVWLLPLLLWRLPVDRAVLRAAVPALRGLNFGVLPLLLYFALRRYLQAAHRSKTIMAALISANLMNATGNWLLIYGHHWRTLAGTVQLPAFSVAGSAWSTSFARVYLMLFLAAALWRGDRLHGYGLFATRVRLAGRSMLQILRLGAPVGAQILVEVAIFALATSVIATFGPLPLAAHEIALQCASVTYMVPMAVAGAATVRVGHAIGRFRTGRATRESVAAAGWSGIATGGAFMAVAALLFVLFPRVIAGLFTSDAVVVQATVRLMLIAAAFQFFDGVQSTATGALRGARRTVAPLLVQAICFWGVAMPLGLFLALHRRGGAEGMWWGLALGLMPAAVVLVWIWYRTTQHPERLSGDFSELAGGS